MALNDDYQALRYEVPEAIRRGLGVGPAQSLDELCLATLSYAHLRHLFTEKVILASSPLPRTTTLMDLYYAFFDSGSPLYSM